jgi:hypothetical protein
VAHHEAGHAGAAVRCGGTVDGIDISWTPWRARGWNHVDIPARECEAFYAYAGSWVDDVLLRPAGEPIDLDNLWFRVQANKDDWAVLQRALGRDDVSHEDITRAEMCGAEGLSPPPPEDKGGRMSPPAGEVRPPTATVLQWHDDLDDEWPRIKALAQRLIDGAAEITVGTGPSLKKVSESCWLRPGFTPDESLNQF